jgi:hypothetical protein
MDDDEEDICMSVWKRKVTSVDEVGECCGKEERIRKGVGGMASSWRKARGAVEFYIRRDSP